jgi:hypothetical protein
MINMTHRPHIHMRLRTIELCLGHDDSFLGSRVVPWVPGPPPVTLTGRPVAVVDGRVVAAGRLELPTSRL